jgi:hypothetical protein
MSFYFDGSHYFTVSNRKIIGICQFSTGYNGIYFGTNDSTRRKLSLYSYINGTWSHIVSESGTSFSDGGYHRLTINIIDYGTSSTINVYCDGIIIINYTTNLVINTVSYFDSIAILDVYPDFGAYGGLSQIIVADEDTRLMKLKTLALNNNGDMNSWSGSYSDITDSTISDYSKLYTSVPDADVQINTSGMPTGNYQPVSVRIITRFVNAGNQYGLQQGVKTNGSIYLSSTQQAVGYWDTKEIIYDTNPITGLPWSSIEIEELQFAYRHKVIS